MPNATSRITPKKKTTDLLTWKTAAVALAVIAALAVVGRAHPTTATRITALATGALILCVDVLHGRRKAIVGTLGALAWVYQLLVVMPLGKGLLIPLAGLVFATYAVGWQGTKRRRVAKVKADFAETKKHLPPGAKQVGKPVVTGRLTRVKFTLPIGTGKWEHNNAALQIAQAKSMGAGQVNITPLHQDHAGMYEQTIRNGKPFDFPDPAYPPLETWPTGHYPLGWDEDGEIVWVPLTGTTAKHYYCAGRTGSGKSNSLQVITNGMSHCGYEFWVIDPHEEFGDFPWRERTTKSSDALAMYQALYGEMKERLADRSRPRQPIHLLTDEAQSVLPNDKAAKIALDLAQEGRKVGIALGFGVQNPKAELFPIDIRSQLVTVLVHRVKGPTEAGVALGPGSVKEGWLPHKLRKQGRGILELEYGEPPRQEVQVFGAHLLPALAPRPLAPPRPLPPPAVEPSGSSVRPPSGGTDQGEQPRTDERTDKPSDTPDPILAALDDTQPMTIPEIMEATKLTKYKVHTTLTEHEKHGRVRRPHGPNKGYVRADTRSA